MRRRGNRSDHRDEFDADPIEGDEPLDEREYPDPDDEDEGIDTIRCRNCGTHIDADAAFCARCGEAPTAGGSVGLGYLVIVVILIAMMLAGTFWF